jgi:hypothetical protein
MVLRLAIATRAARNTRTGHKLSGANRSANMKGSVCIWLTSLSKSQGLDGTLAAETNETRADVYDPAGTWNPTPIIRQV